MDFLSFYCVFAQGYLLGKPRVTMAVCYKRVARVSNVSIERDPGLGSPVGHENSD